MKTPIDNLINDLKDSSVIGNSNSNSYTIHKSQLYYLNNFIAKYNLVTYITNQDNYGNINYTIVWVGGKAWCEREKIPIGVCRQRSHTPWIPQRRPQQRRRMSLQGLMRRGTGLRTVRQRTRLPH